MAVTKSRRECDRYHRSVSYTHLDVYKRQVQMILTLVTSLISNLPQLITSGLNLMKGLASGIANSIPLVAAKAPVIIGKLASTIITNLPKILTAGVQIISKLAVGLVQGIPALIGKIPSMVSQIDVYKRQALDSGHLSCK